MPEKITKATLKSLMDRVRAETCDGWKMKRRVALVRAVEELEALLASYGDLVLFEPNPAQERFLNPPGKPFLPHFRTLLGGNRVGKSEIGFLEAVSFMLGERLWDGKKVPVPVPSRGRIVVTSYLDGGKKVVEPKVRKILPPELIKYTKAGQQGGVIEVALKNGSMFDVVSTEQESMKHEGADLDWIWFDEPFPQDHWTANIRGLIDRGGHMWATLTPLSEPWIKEKLFDPAQYDPDYHAVVALMEENLGFGLSQENMDRVIKNWDEEERAARVRGEFLSLQGRVFKEYKDQYFPDGHLIKPFPIPEHWPRWCGIDPHDRKPTHVMWLTAAENGDIFAYDEAVIKAQDVKDICDAIRDRERDQDEQGYRIIRVMDPAHIPSTESERARELLGPMFARHRVYCLPGQNDIIAGHKTIRQYMKFQQTLRGERPRLLIFDNLIETRKSLLNYIYDDRAMKGSNKDYRNPKENRVAEKWKHMIDVLRYILMMHPEYFHRKDREPKKDKWMHG